MTIFLAILLSLVVLIVLAFVLTPALWVILIYIIVTVGLIRLLKWLFKKKK